MRRPIRNYFSRREQWRLFALIMGLGLVVVVMREASKEENWYWITGESAQMRGVSRRDYDTAYQPTLPTKRSDALTIKPISPPTEDIDGGYFPGVVAKHLEKVEDNRTHQHPEEAAAWFNLWQVLKESESRFIDPASIGPITFGELFEQPDIFRGKLVSITGIARRAEYVSAAKSNPASIEGYYRLILRLRGGPNRPVFLYTLQVPEFFPLGESIEAPVEATAFFYKNWLYQANNFSWIGPVLLAKNIRWEPTAKAPQPITLALGVTLAISLALASVAIAWWLIRQSNQIIKNPEKMRSAYRSPADIDPETVDKAAREHLQELESGNLQHD
tara:strand:+ start:973 stop:1965 length:993 start_codon:yes stop_codon:yes gene_type:complete